jgi:tRNA uridine 5-carboxymethylaminomethyl modification enzyme
MFHVEHRYDVVVVGGGHAGCEAAAVASRIGARVALVTMDPTTVGAMSCNPSIGGIGKGHIVREIDVFGGIMAEAADRAGIHYRMLNRSRGSAVWGPRVQADRALYAAAVQERLRADGVTLVAGEVARLVEAGGRVSGVSLVDGTNLSAGAVVIATGTFLGGRLFNGRTSIAGGRAGEGASEGLRAQLRDLAPVRRLKTGTPPRLDGRSIDWSRLDLQPSDADGWTMAPYGPPRANPQLFCAITHTNPATHDVIRGAADQSPLYSGDIAGAGPRYCPSVEDKVRRFGDRYSHQVFLEPETLSGDLVYPNGISTSLPTSVQEAFVRTIGGLANAIVARPGYAVEYDFLDPRLLDDRLECRGLAGLFLAGQINGTTGYEEAAGQGLVAGSNGAAMALGREAVRFDRHDSYLGVMVDDLSLQGVTEPYRMLTARSEHRLHLRSDNAEARLGRMAEAIGCLSEERCTEVRRRREQRDVIAAGGSVDDADAAALRLEVDWNSHYAPYVERERSHVAKLGRGLTAIIPDEFEYGSVAGLSQEMIERLSVSRPKTVLDAQRIAGVTPAAVTAILAATRQRAA